LLEFDDIPSALGKAALILQVKVLLWKVKPVPPHSESCVVGGNDNDEA